MCVNRLAWSKIASKVGRVIRFKGKQEPAERQQKGEWWVVIIFGKIQAISIKYLDISLRLWRGTNKCFIIEHVRLQCAFHKFRNGMEPIATPLLSSPLLALPLVYRLLVFVTFQLQSNIVALYCVAEIILCETTNAATTTTTNTTISIAHSSSSNKKHPKKIEASE